MIATLALVVVLGLASYRITRVVTRDAITDRFRSAVARWAWDENREQWRGGFRRRVQQLLTCPWCFGVWVSVVVYVWADLARLGREHGAGADVLLIAAVAAVQGLAASRTNA